MEQFIIGIGRRVGYWVQQKYTEAHAIAVEDLNGELGWERCSHEQLMGSFNYDIVIGSTTAWSGSGTRNRILEEMQLGLRDKVSAWKALDSTAYARRGAEAGNPEAESGGSGLTIRVYAIEDTLDNEGGLTLVITGHGNEKVCAGASALWRTMLAGYALIAKEYPRQLSFQLVAKKKKVTGRS
jgi:hypothetical protein